MQLISVIGKAIVYAQPNYVKISVDIKSYDESYNSVVGKAEKAVSEFKASVLNNPAFNKDCIKTTMFNVNTHYEDERLNGEYKRVFKGYVCRHSLQFAFDFNSSTLSEAVNIIAMNSAKPEFNINFTVKNEQTLINKCIKCAVKDAFSKAKLLAEQSGALLGNVEEIKYLDTVDAIGSKTQYLARSVDACAMVAVDISPMDVSVERQVQVVFSMEK